MTLSNQKITRLSRLETIRTRMIAAFLAVALLPFAGLSFIFLVSGAQAGQREAITQLENITNYKENALRDWTNALKIELDNAMVGENMVKDIRKFIRTSPASPEAFQIRDTYIAIRSRFINRVEQSGSFDEIFLLNQDGVVILSTDNTQEGQKYDQRDFFRTGLQFPFVEAPYFSSALGRTMVFAATPVTNELGQAMGVLVGKVNLTTLYDVINDRTGLGETGVTFLVGMDGSLLAGLDPEEHGNTIQTESVRAATEGRVEEKIVYQNYQDIPVIGVYRSIPELQAVLLAEQARIESARSSYAALAINISVALSSFTIALFLALLVTRTIASPVADLAETATRIAEGDRELSAPVDSEDEIGILAQAFNSMTTQLSALIAQLEGRVAERTRALEVRSNYLEASADVSRAAGSILDPDQLVEQAVELIRDRFDLYYIGLFLADSRGEWALLRAGTGQAGKAMLARGHRLPIGSASMIGWCIANAQARVAQEATTDMVRLATPELPHTRSETALPLRSRGRVIGAISVQSEQSNAFDEAFIAVLQSMADQLAVAIDNARLFAESQQALEGERRAYAAQSRTSWDAWLRSQPHYSLRGDDRGVARTEKIWYPEMEQACQQSKTVCDGERLAIPIQIRGNVIGVLDVGRAERQPAGAGQWSSDEIAFLESVAEQMGVALDSARLYAETQQRAEQERLVSQVTSRMRASLDVEAVLKTAIEEIYEALNLDNLVIQMTPQAADQHQNGQAHYSAAGPPDQERGDGYDTAIPQEAGDPSTSEGPAIEKDSTPSIEAP